MKIKPAIYAKAFLAAIDAGAESAESVRRLARTLRRNGDVALAPRVIAAIERELSRRSGARTVLLEFARAPKPAALKDILGEFSKKDRVTTAINPALVAGTRIVIDGEYELDASLVGRLERMFAH